MACNATGLNLMAVTETVGTRNKLGMTIGGLILFETRPNKTWEQRLRWDTLQLGDKTVELVRM